MQGGAIVMGRILAAVVVVFAIAFAILPPPAFAAYWQILALGALSIAAPIWVFGAAS